MSEQPTSSVNKTRPVVLLADDDPVFIQLVEKTLADEYTLVTVRDPMSLMKRIRAEKPHLVLLGDIIHGVACEKILAIFHKNSILLPTIIIMAKPSQQRILALKRFNIVNVLPRNADSTTLLGIVAKHTRLGPTQAKDAPDGKPGVRRPMSMMAPVEQEVRGVLLITGNTNLRDKPDRYVPPQFLEENNISLKFAFSFENAVAIFKNPQNRIRMVITDTTNEIIVRGMLKLLRIVETNLKTPVFFIGDRISQMFENSLKSVGFIYILSRSRVTENDLTEQYLAAINDKRGMNKNLPKKRQNIIEALKSINTISPMPDTYHKIESLAKDPNATSKDYATVLELDTGITARLLRISNSAFYSFNRKIKSVKDTVVLMGTKEILSLVRFACITGGLKTNTDISAAVHKIWEHTACCAITAKFLAGKMSFSKDEDIADEIFICGIIHDIGKIVLWKYFPEMYMDLLLSQDSSSNPSIEEEEAFLGVAHPEIGKAISVMWNLPDVLKDVISLHHDPMKKPDDSRVVITYLSDVISHILMEDIPAEQMPGFNPELLDTIGYNEASIIQLIETNREEILSNIQTVTKMITN